MKTPKKDKEPPKYPEIGARLTRFIEESGQPNARQFAIRAGLSPQLVSHLAAGNSIPGGETLLALATAYKGFDSNWLLTGKGAASVSSSFAPATKSAEPKPDYTTAAGTIDAVVNSLLRQQLADKETIIEMQRKEIERLNSVGKFDDSSDAADDSDEGPVDPNAPTFSAGNAPQPMTRKRAGFQPSYME